MLHLHVPTLLAAAAVVDLALTFFCLSCWQGRGDRDIYKWLSIAGASTMVGSILLQWRASAPDWETVWLAQLFLQIGTGVTWAGIRVFEGRKPNAIAIIAGAAIWTVFCLTPLARESAMTRVVVLSILVSAYYIAIAAELAAGRHREASRSRLLAIAVASIHIISVLARIGLVIQANLEQWPLSEASNRIGFFVLESIVAMIMLVLALTTMERDRAEMEQRRAASTDVLTGALSRRAFLDEAREWIEMKGKDAALILFDLDHFKRVNDTFGHAAGDRALCAFATLVSGRIETASIMAGFNLDAGTSDQYPRWYEATLADAAEGGKPIFGRLGGEEFACLLPHLSLAQSLSIAEDIRMRLQDLEILAGNGGFQMTVSAAVVTTADIGHHLDEMFASSDEALYRAKHAGRNRTETGRSLPALVMRKFA